MARQIPALPQTIGRATLAYQTGNLAEAERLCRRIVASDRNCFDALHLLGVVRAALGKKEKALASYDRALSLRPGDATVLSNRGAALKDLERFDEALASFDLALAIEPRHAEAHNNRGNTLEELKLLEEALDSYDRALAARPNYAKAIANRARVLYQLQRLDEALACLDRVLALQPDSADAHNHRGLTLHALHRFEESVASYDRALALRPDDPVTLSNRGDALRASKRFDEAFATFERALAAKPDCVEALNNRGRALYQLQRFDEALACLDRVIALQPHSADGHNRRGLTLHALHRFEEALASYDRALALRADDPLMLSNRGDTLRELKRFDEAFTAFARALAAKPDCVEALNGRGRALVDCRRLDEAMSSYGRALTLRPDYASAHGNEALLRLLTGDFAGGWPKYEWRWKDDSFNATERDYARPLWLGNDEIAGKTIVLHAEQGLGDTIQFCRYAPLVAARGARVILVVQPALAELMTTLGCDARIVSSGGSLPDHDLHCPLLSLPLALGTRIETIPSATRYLHASQRAPKDCAIRLAQTRRPRIGLVWSGGASHGNDHNRSIGLRSLLPLLGAEATFVSLQKELRADDAAVLNDRNDIFQCGGEIDDFSDTAALVAQLDLVLSVDTSAAHLAGALGRPTWILLPFIPDWRWLLDRDDSPWYPTVRLFRQNETRSWDEVIARVQAALHDFCRASA